MGELVVTNPKETALFLERIGYPIPANDILEVFPGVNPDRRVFRVCNMGEEQSRVLKIRPDNQKAQIEVKKLKPLLSSYRFSGARFQYLRTEYVFGSSYFVINMPWLGTDLMKMATDLDLVKLDQLDPDKTTFAGFSQQKIGRLIANLQRCHLGFAERHGLVHGDIFQHKSPNNVLYFPPLKRLLLVDAEALTKATDDAQARFDKQINNLHEWMHEALLV